MRINPKKTGLNPSSAARALLMIAAMQFSAALGQADPPCPNPASGTLPTGHESLHGDASRIAAHMTPTCSARFREACPRLAATPGVVSRNPDGTVVVNAATNIEAWPAADRALVRPENADNENFRRNIRPLFMRMKATLRAQIAAMPATDPMRQPMLRRIDSMDVEVNNFERCQRPGRTPVVARYDGGVNHVLICPVLSHFSAISLATMLGHEMGHSVDPCDHEFPQPPNTGHFPFAAIHQCASRAQGATAPRLPVGAPATCTRDNEIFADYMSAALTQRTFRADEFPSDPYAATLAFQGFRLGSACDPDMDEYRFFLPPIAQNALAGQVMGCSGFEEEQICPGLVAQ
jgi:hypothetical protein